MLRTDGQHENSIPTTNKVRGGIINLYSPQMVFGHKCGKVFWDRVSYLLKCYVRKKCSQDMSGN